MDREPRPLVRVLDAHLTPDDGPIRVAVSRLPSPQAVADALATAGARAVVADARLTAVTTPSRLVDATGRSLGRPAADALGTALDAAVAAWHAPPPDLPAAGGTLPCSRRTIVMGVLNVTPDSFSDGGRWHEPGDPGPAIEGGRALAAAGADVIDVGGESTRPGAEPVPPEEERARVLPVVEALAGEGLTVSIDTRRAAVARAAVEAGAGIVNDVSAGESDEEMLATVAELGVPYVLMHMKGEPATMQRDPTYDDVVAEVFEYLGDRLERAAGAGIEPSRTVVDPGIGFGKTLIHNLLLLRHLRDLTSLGRPVLVGASRKTFIGQLTATEDPAQRLAGSLAAAAVAVGAGAAIVRVHDVAETVRAVRVARAVADAGAGDASASRRRP